MPETNNAYCYFATISTHFGIFLLLLLFFSFCSFFYFWDLFSLVWKAFFHLKEIIVVDSKPYGVPTTYAIGKHHPYKRKYIPTTSNAVIQHVETYFEGNWSCLHWESSQCTLFDLFLSKIWRWHITDELSISKISG